MPLAELVEFAFKTTPLTTLLLMVTAPEPIPLNSSIPLIGVPTYENVLDGVP
jgi:hypothetical protein